MHEAPTQRYDRYAQSMLTDCVCNLTKAPGWGSPTGVILHHSQTVLRVVHLTTHGSAAQHKARESAGYTPCSVNLTCVLHNRTFTKSTIPAGVVPVRLRPSPTDCHAGPDPPLSSQTVHKIQVTGKGLATAHPSSKRWRPANTDAAGYALSKPDT